MTSDIEREEIINALEAMIEREGDGGYTHVDPDGYIHRGSSSSTATLVKW